MRRTRLLVVGFVTIFVVGTVLGQQEIKPQRWSAGTGAGRDFAESAGVRYLFERPDVRKEIKLTKEQIERHESLVKEAMNGINKSFPITDPTPEGLLAATDRLLMDQGARLREADRRAIAQVLTPVQNRRLEGILVQIAGAFALDAESIQDRLNVDPDRRVEIAEITKTYFKAQGALHRRMGETRFGTDRTAYKLDLRDQPQSVVDQLERQEKELEALRAQASARIMRLLTKRQRDLLKKMQGEPFEGLEAMKIPGQPPAPGAPKPDVPQLKQTIIRSGGGRSITISPKPGP